MIKVELAKKYSDELIYCSRLIFNEWGKGDFESKLEKIYRDNNAKCYVVYDNNEIVGTFVIRDNDIPNRPDLNPNLACVCVDGRFRGKGYGFVILNESKKVLGELGIKKAYLKTTLENFYEKVGWVYMESFESEEGVEKIYCLDLK